MKLTGHLGGQTTAFRLTRAVLIYEPDTAASTDDGRTARWPIATMHDITTGADGRPELGPGECARPEAVQGLAVKLLNASGKMQPIDPRLLALGLDGMLWHCPPSMQPLWFKPREGEPDRKILAKLSGERFPQPHLLFRADSHGLSVFAVRGPRITLRSALYRAPYWNLSPTGQLCAGTARLQKLGLSPALIPAYEKSFFESAFTHPNATGVKLTAHPGGHTGLWQSLLGKRRFPDTTLVRIQTGDRKARKPFLTMKDLL